LDQAEGGDRDYVRRKELTAATLDQLRNIASDIFGIPADKITTESSPQTVESWDSMQHLSLVLAVEEKFGVQFDPEEIERMTNIGAVVALIEKLQSAPR
jgi:acyl carrier protein